MSLARMHLFYDLSVGKLPGDAVPQTFVLNEEDSWHCTKVLRLRNSDKIAITDGRGLLCTGLITEPHPQQCLVQIIEYQHITPRGYKLHIAIAPTKHADRLEWFIEKATETGIDEITPLICARSEKSTIRPDRLNKIMVAAMKQSLGTFLPSLHSPTTFGSFIQVPRPDSCFIAWCGDASVPLLSHTCPVKQPVTVLIGPEGDFTPEEVELAKKYNFVPISLGTSRLRTETAALAACFCVHFRNDI